MIIVPDIHGRSFWREPILRHFLSQRLVGDAEESEKVIFLGDYLDPYPKERISMMRAMEVLEEIIALKREYPDEVVLLLGNHDLPYILPHLFTSGRHDSFYEDDAHRLFTENLSLFCLLHSTAIGGRKYLFSHAGVHPEWTRRKLGTTDFCEIEQYYAKPFLRIDPKHLAALNSCSFFRGGAEDYGSFVWADVEEFAVCPLKDADTEPQNECYQIFGHTQQKERPITTDDYACLDCRQLFTLDKDGRLSILDRLD